MMTDRYLEGSDLSENINAWLQLLKSENACDRADALDHIPDDASDKLVIDVILNCLQDTNSLVRICAADAARLLRGYPDIVEALRLFIHREDDALALAFGYESIGRLGSYQDIPLFIQGLNTTTNLRTRLGILSGFCMLIRCVFLSEIYLIFKSNNVDLCDPSVNEFLNMISDEMLIEKDLLYSTKMLLSDINPEMKKSVEKLTEILKLRTSASEK